MAHHQKHTIHRTMSDLAVSPFGSRHVERLAVPEDDDAADVDEPPEQHIQFARHTYKPIPGEVAASSRTTRSHSLLTERLTSPQLRAVSAYDAAMLRGQSTASNDSAVSGVSTAELTSDGGLTSPARTSTPSPPLPSTLGTGLSLVPTKSLDSPTDEMHHTFRLHSSNTAPIVAINPPNPEAPRKRCITFACSTPRKEHPSQEQQKDEKPAEEPKRRSCLKFACPLKPNRHDDEKSPTSPKARRASPAPSKMQIRKHRDSESTIKDEEKTVSPQKKKETEVSKKTNPEGLRFHEFAASKPHEDAWVNATPVSSRKLTVTDCLRKENAIRKIGEEAEEEALDEEEDDEDEDLEDELEGLDDEEDEDVEDEDTEEQDDGNETDDEEGFADSDDESDAGSDFRFWTPATTTAATSIDHLEHIRPRQHRTVSESSIEYPVEIGLPIEKPRNLKHGKTKRRAGSPRMRPGTPELPDSTDFVCGTLDEDQALEAAYLSCMEQRRIARHGLLPQDVDPSFPTSEPEEEEDDDDQDVLDDDESDSHIWIPGRPDDMDEETPHRGRTGATQPQQQQQQQQQQHHHPTKSPMPTSPKRRLRSPDGKRMKSPAPMNRKAIAIHSPAPVRRLFNHSPAPIFSPGKQIARSPPLTRRGSPMSDDTDELHHTHNHLAQRPHLTHTKSLPRTPNPFWREHRRRRLAEQQKLDGATVDLDSSDAAFAAAAAEGHSRGPIDIVQGLEHKRQRRKEKFWRQHCRHAAKEKEKFRRPQPGKGAERMRELGLEVADRTKGYGQRLQLVLSI